MNSIMNTRLMSHSPKTLNDWDRIFNAFFGSLNDFEPEMMKSHLMGTPNIDLQVTDQTVHATLPLPGCKSSEIQVEVIGNWMTIRSKRECCCKNVEGKKYLRKECHLEDFEETIHIPVRVKGQEAKAKYTDGILTIEIPRDIQGPQTHVITVQ